jgi:hypothetical protein
MDTLFVHALKNPQATL